jgi:hypothetical protein
LRRAIYCKFHCRVCCAWSNRGTMLRIMNRSCNQSIDFATLSGAILRLIASCSFAKWPRCRELVPAAFLSSGFFYTRSHSPQTTNKGRCFTATNICMWLPKADVYWTPAEVGISNFCPHVTRWNSKIKYCIYCYQQCPPLGDTYYYYCIFPARRFMYLPDLQSGRRAGKHLIVQLTSEMVLGNIAFRLLITNIEEGRVCRENCVSEEMVMSRNMKSLRFLLTKFLPGTSGYWQPHAGVWKWE